MQALGYVERLEQVDLLLEGQVGGVATRVGQRAGLLDRVDEGLDDNLRSFFEQEYPEFEILFAARNQTDYALSVILQSPLQIALVLAPVLVLIAPLVGATFTLVISPLLVASLLIAAIVTVLVVNDGESTWLEGATLVVLYALIATSFWWG